MHNHSIKSDQYLPARQVWERYGVSSMTVYRWLNDAEMAFPSPVYFGRYRYWRVADLVTWERENAARSR